MVIRVSELAAIDLFFFMKAFKNSTNSNSSQSCELFLQEVAGRKIPAPLIDFDLLESQFNELNRRILDETLFVVPANDGEAIRAIQILQSSKAKHLRVSSQSWGAVLEKESILKEKMPPEIKRIAFFEIPGVKEEEELRKMGYEVVFFDHHAYRDLDRRRPESSLEQLANFINWPMSNADKAIAVNDRSYIPGLKQMGLTEKQIQNIRIFDLVSQGRSQKDIEKGIEKARSAIATLRKIGSAFVLDDPKLDGGIVKQELAIMSPTGIVNTLDLGDMNIGYSGSPAVVKKLLALDLTQFGYVDKTYARYGGGDEKNSMFFGFKPTVPPHGQTQLISYELVRAVEAIVEELVP